MAETANEIQTARVMVASTARGSTSHSNQTSALRFCGSASDEDPQHIQGNAIGYRLKKRAAGAVGVKPQAFVKNEAGKDERARVDEKGDGNENEIGERER